MRNQARSAQFGVIVAAVAGVAWTLWGASGLSGGAAAAVRVIGIAIGLAMFVKTVRTQPTESREQSEPRLVPSRGSAPMFSSRSYLVVAVAEVAGIAIGNRVLGATGHAEYIIAWVAIVVGLHFVALGRLFFVGFYGLGLALVVAGLMGAAIGGIGGGAAGINATAGLISGASIFGAGARTFVAQARAQRAAVLGAPVEVV